MTEPAPMLSPREATGDHLRLDWEDHWWWRVQAVSEHFTACVHQARFEPKGTLCYTVLDWRNGQRGPCNLIGQGYGDGSYSEQECAEMLAEFERVEDVCPTRGPLYALEVSHRNNVPLRVLEVRRVC